MRVVGYWMDLNDNVRKKLKELESFQRLQGYLAVMELKKFEQNT